MMAETPYRQTRLIHRRNNELLSLDIILDNLLRLYFLSLSISKQGHLVSIDSSGTLIKADTKEEMEAAERENLVYPGRLLYLENHFLLTTDEQILLKVV